MPPAAPGESRNEQQGAEAGPLVCHDSGEIVVDLKNIRLPQRAEVSTFRT
jgi:hypothetical protein